MGNTKYCRYRRTKLSGILRKKKIPEERKCQVPNTEKTSEPSELISRFGWKLKQRDSRVRWGVGLHALNTPLFPPLKITAAPSDREVDYFWIVSTPAESCLPLQSGLLTEFFSSSHATVCPFSFLLLLFFPLFLHIPKSDFWLPASFNSRRYKANGLA